MSQGPSLLETLTNAATTSEHRECVQGKEVAYGAKQLEPQYADAEFVPESGKSEPGSSGTKCKLESGHTGDALG